MTWVVQEAGLTELYAIWPEWHKRCQSFHQNDELNFENEISKRAGYESRMYDENLILAFVYSNTVASANKNMK